MAERRSAESCRSRRAARRSWARGSLRSDEGQGQAGLAARRARAQGEVVARLECFGRV